MNRNNMLLMGLAVFFVIGVGLTAYMLRGGSNPAAQPGAGPAPTPPPVKTFVAVKDIPPRTLITANMLTESTDDKPTAGAITDIDQVVGKLSTEPIYAGQVVKTSMTTEEIARVVPASFRIPKQNQENLRAVGIWVDPLQTAAGLVDKGDRVDVIAVHKLKVTGSNTNGDIASGRTIAQDLEVLAVDRSLEVAMKPTPVPAPAGPPGAPAAAPAPPPAPTPPPQPGQKTFTRVIVAALPETAERLVAANTTGELHITIRDPQTRENFPIAGVREYPAVPVDPMVQKVRDAAVTRRLDNIRRADELKWKRIETQEAKRLNPPIPSVGLDPMKVGVIPTPVPTADVREITVVRGTEKTRVIVPR